MNRGTIIGATGGLIAGVSLGALALASPAMALFSHNSASVAAPAAAQLGGTGNVRPARRSNTGWVNIPSNAADGPTAIRNGT